jgi:hypothetical protein
MIILNLKGSFNYIERDKEESITTYTLSEHPVELKKKVNLLKKTKEQIESSKEALESPNKLFIENKEIANLVYLKKYISTGKGVVFNLSNKIIQANFYDNTELLINPEVHEVVYLHT